MRQAFKPSAYNLRVSCDSEAVSRSTAGACVAAAKIAAVPSPPSGQQDAPTGVIDIVCFDNILALIARYKHGLQAWQRYSPVPTIAALDYGLEEDSLFQILRDSAKSASRTPPDPATRAERMLDNLPDAAQTRMRKQLSKMHVGVIDRKWLLGVYHDYQEDLKHLTPNTARPQPIQRTPSTSLPSAQTDPNNLHDISILCSSCQSNFVYSVGEQQFAADKNHTHQPTRCKECREKYKTYMASQPCRSFQRNGTCQYGDSCRFKHDPSSIGKAASPITTPTQSTGRRRTIPCYFFSNNGTCSKGDSCHFVHEKSNSTTTATINMYEPVDMDMDEYVHWNSVNEEL